MDRTKPRLVLERLECRAMMATDLSVEFELMPTSAIAGATLEFSFAASNLGSNDVDGVLVEETSPLENKSWRAELGFATVYDVGDLDGSNGFQIRLAPTEITVPIHGDLVAVGDVNGDGLNDFAIENLEAEVENPADIFVVFGRRTPFGPILELESLTQGTGVILRAFESTSLEVRGVGDINGDGFDDIAVGAPGADEQGSYLGETYVVFGAASIGGTIELSQLDGRNGFTALGVHSGGFAGSDVAGGDDVNGDGIDDFVIGAIFEGPEETVPGAAYVVFGSRTPFPRFVDLANLDGANGFTIVGSQMRGRLGQDIELADVNGDGVGDIILSTGVGGPLASTYVVFGGRSNITDVSLGDLKASEGFVLQGELISGDLGDVNADGFADFSLCSIDGCFVVFGAREGATVSQVRSPIYPAGDVNADGFDDYLLHYLSRLPLAEPFHNWSFGWQSVVFGSSTLADDGIPSSLDGTNGFSWIGTGDPENPDELEELVQFGVKSSPVGDVNGDGIDDLIVASPKSFAYVVFGRPGALDGIGPTLDSIDLNVGEVMSYTVTGMVPDAVSLTFQVNISSPTGIADETLSNNTATFVLIVTPRQVGDLDGDGIVDFPDFLLLAHNFGRQDEDVTEYDGDLDGDGLVGFSDFLLLAANFGS